MTDDAPLLRDETMVDEGTPLLNDRSQERRRDDVQAENRPKRRITPLPRFQIAIVLLQQLCEPLTSQSIYPYINRVRIRFRVFFLVIDADRFAFFSLSASWALQEATTGRLGTTLG